MGLVFRKKIWILSSLPNEKATATLLEEVFHATYAEGDRRRFEKGFAKADNPKLLAANYHEFLAWEFKISNTLDCGLAFRVAPHFLTKGKNTIEGEFPVPPEKEPETELNKKEHLKYLIGEGIVAQEDNFLIPVPGKVSEFDIHINKQYLYWHVHKSYKSRYDKSNWKTISNDAKNETETRPWNCDAIKSDTPLPEPVAPR